MADLWVHPKKFDLYSQCHYTQRPVSTAAHQFTALFAKETHESIMRHQVLDPAESL